MVRVPIISHPRDDHLSSLYRYILTKCPHILFKKHDKSKFHRLRYEEVILAYTQVNLNLC